MAEVYKTINGYSIYIGGTWCEVTKNGNHIYDGSVEEGMTAEEVYKQIKEMEKKRKSINIDMWYGDKHTEADKIDITFYDLDCEYRGNIYKDGKIIGDYSCNDSLELEKAFPQLTFNWD